MQETSREEFRNVYGSGLRLTYKVRAYRERVLPLAPPGPLEERLELVRGVGPKAREALAAQGYRTIAELAGHPRYGRHAGRVFSALASRNVPELLRAGARDIELAPLFSRDEFAVIDIETAGLWQVLPVFLIGVGFDLGGEWEIRQYLARSFEEEAAILHEAIEALDGRSVCVTYNGKAFDEPFVRARLALHGIRPLRFRLHIDLLHSCRRSLGAVLPDCKLATVGEFALGMARPGDVPGSLVPDLYFRFVRDGDWSAVEPVLRHNAWDLAALCRLLDAGGVEGRPAGSARQAVGEGDRATDPAAPAGEDWEEKGAG